MADWKRVLTAEGDQATHQNDKITLAQLFAGIEAGGATAGANQILKANANHTALVWADDSGGIALTDISMASNASASGGGNLTYDNSSGEFTFTPALLTNLPNQDVDTTASPSWVDGTFTGGDLYVKGGEGDAATLYLYADEGDDSADKWTITTGTAGGSLSFQQDGTTELAISSAGQVTTTGDLIVGGNDIKGAGGGTCMTLNGTDGSVTFSGAVIAGNNAVSGASGTFQGGDLIVKTSANSEVFKIDNTNGTGTDSGTMTGDFTITGNLTVNGGTTNVSTTNLVVEDKTITIANGAADVAGASGSGIIVDMGSTASEMPDFIWLSGRGGGNTDGSGTANGLTGWTVSNSLTSNFKAHPVAIMDFDSDAAASGDTGAGIGSFHFDTTNQNLYIRTA